MHSLAADATSTNAVRCRHDLAGGAPTRSALVSAAVVACPTSVPQSSTDVSPQYHVASYLRGRLRFQWLNIQPHDSPNEPHASPPGGFPSAFNRASPIEPLY